MNFLKSFSGQKKKSVIHLWLTVLYNMVYIVYFEEKNIPNHSLPALDSIFSGTGKIMEKI